MLCLILNCQKLMHISKIHSLFMGRVIHDWKHILLTPPLPLISVKNSWLSFTWNHCVALLCTGGSTNDNLHNLIKAQPSTQSTRSQSPTRLSIQLQDLGLPNTVFSIGHCGLSAASRQTCFYKQVLLTLLATTGYMMLQH